MLKSLCPVQPIADKIRVRKCNSSVNYFFAPKNLNIMHKLFITILVLAGSFFTYAQENPLGEEWIQLFNGKDLKNWDIKIKGHPLNENYKNTFRVEDGLLKVRYDQYDHFNDKLGHIFYNGIFSHYRLRVEYRFVGEQLKGGKPGQFMNNGIMIHGQTADSCGRPDRGRFRKRDSCSASLQARLREGRCSSNGKCPPAGPPRRHKVLEQCAM